VDYWLNSSGLYRDYVVLKSISNKSNLIFQSVYINVILINFFLVSQN
jgi:hypothetical protein